MKQRLIDANKLRYRIGLNEDGEQIFYIEGKDIDAQPTVDAVPVVCGRWLIDGPIDEDGNRQFVCSRCLKKDLHSPQIKVPYCWYCGAKMYLEY